MGTTHRLTRAAALATLATALVPATAQAGGLINLELRLETASPMVGDTIDVALYAVRDAPGSQQITGVQLVLGWDPETLELVGLTDPEVWFASGFFANGGEDVNESSPPTDGDAWYQMGDFSTNPDGYPDVTDAGFLITTFHFLVLGETPGTVIDILPEPANHPAALPPTGGWNAVFAGPPAPPLTVVTGTLSGVGFNVGGCADDADGDGVCTISDNCPDDPNADQADADADGIGDVCDDCPDDPDNDIDGDGACGDVDNCPLDSNPGQADNDGDGFGNACDICPGGDDSLDTDFDGIPDTCDPCPFEAGGDSDGDGVCDSADACPGFDDNVDSDADGIPDGCDDCPNDPDNDSDGDGVCGDVDNCPDASNKDQADGDGDGFGDACDACPANPGNLDEDEDGICDDADNCPSTPNPDQADNDADGFGNACEPCPPDVDNSGAVDVDDLIAVIFDWNAVGTSTDVNFDGVVDVDDLLDVIFGWGPCDG